MVSVMIVAAMSVHWPQLFAQNNGIEVPLLYGASAAALALTGFGAYSLDNALGLTSLWTPTLTWGVLVIGAIGEWSTPVSAGRPRSRQRMRELA